VNQANELRRGRFPIHFAAQNGHIPTVGALLFLRARAEVVDQEKRQAIHIAALHGQTEMVAKLVKIGANIQLLFCVNIDFILNTARKGHVLVKIGAPHPPFLFVCLVFFFVFFGDLF
jgi:ankyrin repeat protein